MSNETDDQKWLEALGGARQGGEATMRAEMEALAIRDALIRQSQSRPEYQTSKAHFQKILAEAGRQGLLRKEKASGGLGTLLGNVYAFLTMPAAVMASVTLVLGLSVTVGWQAHELSQTEEITVRGGAAEKISLIVSSPKETARAWQEDLLAAGIGHSVSFEQPNKILIRMKLTPDVIRLLEGKRIQVPAGEWCKLVIEAANR